MYGLELLPDYTDMTAIRLSISKVTRETAHHFLTATS